MGFASRGGKLEIVKFLVSVVNVDVNGELFYLWHNFAVRVTCSRFKREPPYRKGVPSLPTSQRLEMHSRPLA